MHKKVKDGVRNVDRKSLEQKCNKLRFTLYNELAGKEGIYDICSEHIQKYFSKRSDFNVRICIKAQDKDGFFYDYYRYNAPQSPKKCRSDQNTGINEIVKMGRYYLCNNIPNDVKNEEYKNPRLNGKDARQHMLKYGEIRDQKTWKNYWYRFNDQGEKVFFDESSYMSTLIIPMTLLNNKNLDENFRSHFKIPVKSEDENHRAIYALLCLDHVESNFFIEELDATVGYIFADIMSLYLISYLMYVDFSGTFKKAHTIVE